MSEARDVPIAEQIRTVEREVRMREYVYPRRVNDGAMTKKKADQEIAAMKAVLETLRRIGAEQGQLFTQETPT